MHKVNIHGREEHRPAALSLYKHPAAVQVHALDFTYGNILTVNNTGIGGRGGLKGTEVVTVARNYTRTQTINRANTKNDYSVSGLLPLEN